MKKLSFADVEIDEARFELRRDGELVEVQPKVLELILYLARHRDRVVSKEELFARLWDGTTVTEGSLTQALSLARKALGDSAREARMIRTVRGRGLQFVATVEPPARGTTQLLTTHAGSTAMETQPETVGARETSAPVLFAALVADAPGLGGESWWLGDVDEVQIGRGSRLRAKREDDLTRVLHITVPGRRLSRQHARVVRVLEGWMVVDEGSRNGTFVNGERIEQCDLTVGDRIDCGRATFMLGHSDLREHCGAPSPHLHSILPSLRQLDAAFGRVGASELPLLLLGESGTGKTHLAEAIHRHAGRTGLYVVDLATFAERPEEPPAVEGGTLLLEGLDRLAPELAPRLANQLARTPDARTIATSQVSYAILEERLPRDLLSRLAGYRAVLPPLRERLGDLGALIPHLLQSPRPLTPEAVDRLLAHAWPGNLRELAHVLEAAAVLADGGAIDSAHLPADLGGVTE